MDTEDSIYSSVTACKFVIGVIQQQQCTELQEHKAPLLCHKNKGWPNLKLFHRADYNTWKVTEILAQKNQFPVA